MAFGKAPLLRWEELEAGIMDCILHFPSVLALVPWFVCHLPILLLAPPLCIFVDTAWDGDWFRVSAFSLEL